MIVFRLLSASKSSPSPTNMSGVCYKLRCWKWFGKKKNYTGIPRCMLGGDGICIIGSLNSCCQHICSPMALLEESNCRNSCVENGYSCFPALYGTLVWMKKLSWIAKEDVYSGQNHKSNILCRLKIISYSNLWRKEMLLFKRSIGGPKLFYRTRDRPWTYE